MAKDPGNTRQVVAEYPKILDSFHTFLEEKAFDWQQGGRTESHLLEEHGYILAGLWARSKGGNTAPVSEVLEAFLAGCVSHFGEAHWHNAFCGNACCSQCGERFQVENLFFCTNCSRLTCPSCYRKNGVHPSGNQLCVCGGQLVG